MRRRYDYAKLIVWGTMLLFCVLVWTIFIVAVRQW